MGLIKNFTTFMNSVFMALVTQTEMTAEQVDSLLDEVDAYDWYCQNTTQESEAQPSVYANKLIRNYSLI